MKTETAPPPSPRVAPRPRTRVQTVEWWRRWLPPADDRVATWGLTARDRWVLTILLVPMVFMITLHTWRWVRIEQSTVTVLRAPAEKYTFQVDVNAASWIEWAQLDGIGEKLARRIVADRTERGPFRSVDDLDRVKGIGPKTLEKLRPHLTIAASE